jgi:hypothetical protein
MLGRAIPGAVWRWMNVCASTTAGPAVVPAVCVGIDGLEALQLPIERITAHVNTLPKKNFRKATMQTLPGVIQGPFSYKTFSSKKQKNNDG